jgi:hypothetical protein
MDMPFFMAAKTDEEISLVCLTEDTPAHTLAREDGWKAFRIVGILDFGLTGILAKIADVLAEEQIPLFAVSTFNTYYILVRKEYFSQALHALKENGWTVMEGNENERNG